MKKKDSRGLHIQLREDLWPKIERFQFTRRIPTRTKAIEELLTYALKKNPRYNDAKELVDDQ